jgi:transposase
MYTSQSGGVAQREAIRLRALQLFLDGWSMTAIARAFDVTVSAVSQWMKKVCESGDTALYARKPPGARPRLTDAERDRLVELLKEGAEAHGFTGNVWTAARVTQLIWTTFGVRYGERHVRRLLHQLNWSPQTPVKRAVQRDEEAIARFREIRYNELKKMPKRGPPTVIYR